MNVRVILCERKSVLGDVISKAMRRVIVIVVVVVEIKIKCIRKLARRVAVCASLRRGR